MGSDDKVFSTIGPYDRFINFLTNFIEKPVVWFRENVVVPNRQKYYWYHEKIRRVPTVDECYTDDVVCIYEANEQYLLDRKVDKFIVKILRKRYEYCAFENYEDPEDCDELKKAFERGATNFFIKYGDLGWRHSALKCLMKQKNRMAWERRHGPVGSGRKTEETELNSH